MSFYNVKGSYFEELIKDLIVIELEVSIYSRKGRLVSKPLLRAKKYKIDTKDGESYDKTLYALCQHVITELSFLTTHEAETVSRRFQGIEDSCDFAWESVSKHRKEFKDQEFDIQEFKSDFHTWFSLPETSLQNLLPEKPEPIITDDLFLDLFDALNTKYEVTSWIKLQLEHMYFSRRIEKTSFSDNTIQAPSPRQIIIPDAIRDSLYNILSKYTTDDQHTRLIDLLRGKAIDSPIILDCPKAQTKLGEAFARVIDDIELPHVQCADWLCDNFRRNNSGLKPELSKATIINKFKNRKNL